MVIPNIRAAKYKGTKTGMVSRSFGERLDETYNVMDFGAINDGVTDNGPRITAAVTEAESNPHAERLQPNILLCRGLTGGFGVAESPER